LVRTHGTAHVEVAFLPELELITGRLDSPSTASGDYCLSIAALLLADWGRMHWKYARSARLCTVSRKLGFWVSRPRCRMPGINASGSLRWSIEVLVGEMVWIAEWVEEWERFGGNISSAMSPISPRWVAIVTFSRPRLLSSLLQHLLLVLPSEGGLRWRLTNPSKVVVVNPTGQHVRP
jgi:hypothetical protein